MSQPDLSEAAPGACIACKRLKRKCDKTIPECSTCVRVGRTCRYDSIPRWMYRETASPPTLATPVSSSDEGLASNSSFFDKPPVVASGSAVLPVDLLRRASLQQPAVDVTICGDAIKVLGTRDEVAVMAGNYFDTLSNRMPFISRNRFFSRLPSLFTNPHADFSLLCLCVHLVAQYPPACSQVMHSSVYFMIKGHISLLEASGFLSLIFVQARLLISIFEMGHGLYPAASVSLGACTRTARALGLNKQRFADLLSDETARQRAEERKRVWWEIVILDRFVNLCTGDALFGTEDPRPDDLLPINDDEWAADTVPLDNHPTVTTPADIRVGPFARECQISHLMGRVLRHVFEPSSDAIFYKQEFEQLEKTLMAFLPLLLQEEPAHSKCCAALSMCSCALFTLYDSELLLNRHNEAATNRVLQCMEDTATRVAQFSVFLFSPIENGSKDAFSPFVPYSLYQAAAVQLRMWRLTKDNVYGEHIDSLKTLLGHFNVRWRAAGIYLDALENLNISFPITMHSMLGASVSACGPSYQVSRLYM